MTASNQQNYLLSILRQPSIVRKTLLQLLPPQDILNLMHISKIPYHAFSTNGQLPNFLYYSQNMSIEKSYSLDKELYGINQQVYRERIWNLCSNGSLDFTQNILQLKQAESEFVLCSSILIGKQQSSLVLQQFKRILIDPQPSRPIMRRKTVGEYCRSSIQIKMVTEGYESIEEVYMGEEDQELKKAFLEKAEQILQYISKQENYQQLLQLRYRGEITNKCTISTCEMVSIIKIILKITNNYISSIKIFLIAAQNSLSSTQFLQEFIYRYSCFRNSATQLNEKFQYIFQNFQRAFHEVFAKHPKRPRFHLWRLMMKQWVTQMSVLHPTLNKISQQMAIQNIQKQIESLILNQTSDQQSFFQFNNCFRLQRFKTASLFVPDSLNSDSTILSFLFGQYSQYLVDISSNSLNAHWYGSTELRLQKSYAEFEVGILEQAKQYHEQSISSFSSQHVRVKLCQFFINIAITMLKPCTASKIQVVYKEYIDGMLQNSKKNINNSFWSKNYMVSYHDWEQQNQKIKIMNFHRRIKQEVGQQLVSFFSLQQGVSLQEVQFAVKKYLSDQDNLGMEEQTILQSNTIIF